MSAPILRDVSPNAGDPGDRFTVQIEGDTFLGTSACDFGLGVIVERFVVKSDGLVEAKIAISSQASSGPRDVSLANPSGIGVLRSGFRVR